MANHARPAIQAENRPPATRKSDLRAMRSQGQVPASLFGHGEPQNICLSARELGEYLRRHGTGGILDVSLDGQVSPAIIREIQRHPVTGALVSIGLQRVDLRETLRAQLPIVIQGEEALIADGSVLQVQLHSLEVHGRADALPESIAVDVSALTPGTTIRIADLSLPEGVETTRDPEQPVLSVTVPSVSADVAAALDAEEAAHAAAAEEAAHAAEAEEAETEEGEPAPAEA